MYILISSDSGGDSLINSEDIGIGCHPERAVGRDCEGRDLPAQFLRLRVGRKFSTTQKVQAFVCGHPDFITTVLGQSVDVVFWRTCLNRITGELSGMVSQNPGAISANQKSSIAPVLQERPNCVES